MITFKNVTYKIHNKTILSNINFNIKDGEKVLIMGQSGSGKTTIFNLLLKNIEPTSGEIIVDKINLEQINNFKLNNFRKEKIIMISQVDDLFENKTVIDNLEMFYLENDVISILKKVNLLHLKDRYIYSLSGGERQRIAIIKACLSSCDILLCDEITSALDQYNAKLIIDFILKIFTKNTIIFISHDNQLLNNKIDHFIYLEEHKIKENKIINDITNFKLKDNKKIGKSLIFVALTQGFKKISIPLLIIYILTIICFFISLNFQKIFLFYAKQSYEKYFDYDVLLVKDNKDLIVNNIDSFANIDDILNNSLININNHEHQNIRFSPFNNKNQHKPLVVNQLFMEVENLNNIFSFEIINNQFNEKFDDVEIINENNLFTNACVYYDIKYFSDKNIFSNNNEIYLIDYDFTKMDERFTNNPLFISKQEDKPYLESRAYNDYLTFEMVFDAIKKIVNYFFILLMFFSIIILFLINFSRLLKDAKYIAIYISRGYSDFEILIAYLLTIFIYTFFFILLVFFIKDLLYPILLAFCLQFIATLVSYYYLKNKNLYDLLKEDSYS